VANKMTCLLLADLVNGNTLLFGLTVDAKDYPEGIRKVAKIMAANDGKTSVLIESPQIFIKKQFIVCPACQGVVPAAATKCPGCAQDMRSPAVLQALKEGNARVITKIEQELRAEMEGSMNEFRLRPEHVVLYDFIPESSLNYKMWFKVNVEAKARMAAKNSNSNIVLPDVGQVAAINKSKVPDANPAAKNG